MGLWIAQCREKDCTYYTSWSFSEKLAFSSWLEHSSTHTKPRVCRVWKDCELVENTTALNRYKKYS